MNRSSTVTLRDRPLVDVTTSGSCHVVARTLEISTTQRIEIVDITERIMTLVREMGIREGLANLLSLHTTCGVLINEYQAALAADLVRFLDGAVDENARWLHDDPAHSDCDRNNAGAHLRALLVGHSLTLPVSDGELVLGQWQRVLMTELDGPRPRTLRLSVQGIG